MAYMSVSFTHKNTDITVREKLSFSNDVRKKEILRLLAYVVRASANRLPAS